MWPWYPPQSSTEAASSGLAPGAKDADVAWRRPLCALTGNAVPGPGFPPPVQAVWGDLSEGQQHLAAAILSHLSLSPAAGAAMVDLQRERLRAGALRRSDDIETLAALVRLLVGRPLTTSAEVQDIHRAYEHLRQCHWWPSGPEDLPLAALLVAGAVDADRAIVGVEEMHLALSEGDEVPGDPCALVALCGCVPDLTDAQVVVRLGALRTELLLSGMAVQETDSAMLLALVAIPGDPALVMGEFVAERRKHAPAPNAPVAPLTIALAADAVVLRDLSGVARQVYIASLAIRAWMIHRHHQPRPATRNIRRSS
jgi:hypothetical protein